MMRHQKGFSLVELSIVLVILGLLTGGILAGQNLIRAAELRKVTDQFMRYQTATQTFRDKYFALPGDFKDATKFWLAIDATPATCIATASPDHKKTCDGDGDGYVNKSSLYANGGYERYHFWLHLANAGLIEGSYNGLTATAGSFVDDPGVNTPLSPFPKNPWHAFSAANTYSGDAEHFDGTKNFHVVLTTRGIGSPLTPEEMWNLDIKMDDGRPAYGKVYTYKKSGIWAPNCADGDTPAANYNLTYKSKGCNFVGVAM